MRTFSCLLVVVLALSGTSVRAVDRTTFYPFGDGDDLELDPAMDDSSSVEEQLSVPVKFFRYSFTSLFVNSNGMISFLTELPNYASVPLPLEFPIIAPFYSDVDTRATGTVYYREVTEGGLLERATDEVRQNFRNQEDFQATSLFIATWDEVGAYEMRQDETNTFQVVLMSDGSKSFANFFYLDDGMQWFVSDGKNAPTQPDPPAQAAMDAGDGNDMYTLPLSGTERVLELARRSNIGKPGAWMFFIGETDRIQEPDIMLKMAGNDGVETVESGQEATSNLEAADSCVQGGSSTCHGSAQCMDYNPGFCCECLAPAIGNGILCIDPVDSQRINGKLSGSVNGEQLTGVDLHGYVVMSDGRSYAAFSRIPPTIGFSLLPVSPIGAILGWLFAQASGNAKNGFMLTGGSLKRTATVRFTQTGDVLTVTQTFTGADVHNHLRMDTTIEGNIPDLPENVQVEMDDYKEEYHRESPGILKSYSERTYKVDGVEYQYSWEQTVTFEECASAEVDEAESSERLAVSRNFVTYDDQQQILRYAMTSKISLLNGVDPCEGNDCGPYAKCMVEGTDYRCICNNGFQGDGFSCIDIDECVHQRHRCDANARCMNTQGSYQCQCLPGFNGDGFRCQQEKSCSDLQCDPNAQCTYEPNTRVARCQCLSGFQGDGNYCEPASLGQLAKKPCNALGQCGEFGECEYDVSAGRYMCACFEGYGWDGTGCVVTGSQGQEGGTCDVARDCDVNARCIYDDRTQGYYCQCNPTHSGNGYSCMPRNDAPSQEDCSVLQDCHADAACVYDDYAQRYACICNSGYRGDGLTQCVSEEEAGCDVLRNCHDYAECMFNQNSKRYECRCQAGLEGDGINQCQSQQQRERLSRCEHERKLAEYYRANDKPETHMPKCAADGSYMPLQCQEQPEHECWCAEPQSGRELTDTRVQGGEPDCPQPQEPKPQGIVPQEPRPQDCSTLRNCAEHASCVYDERYQQYMCVCTPGYVGDGYYCDLDGQQQETSGCEVLRNCGENARCSWDYNYQKYACQCDPGFQGDGYNCYMGDSTCEEDVGVCDENAACQYDNGYECVCRAGWVGNGYQCTEEPAQGEEDTATCYDDPRMCDTNAECVRDPSNRYTCRCRSGFEGNGRTCQHSQSSDSPYLMYTQGMTVLRVPYSPSAQEAGRHVMFLPGQIVVGIDLDCKNKHVYWTDIVGGTISRAMYEGSEQEQIISADLESPEGVAVDWLSGLLFWTDSGQDLIAVSKLDGSQRRILIDTNLINPRGIAVDPIRGKLYFTDWNRLNPKIEVANMDGTDREILVSSELSLPNSLTIDYYKEELCWADAGNHRVECIGLDGAYRRTVTEQDDIYPFGITNHGDRLYWTDWTKKSIMSINKLGRETASKLETPVGGNGKLYGIIAVLEQCPRGTNACAVGNGGCDYLCVPVPGSQRKCLCPDNQLDCEEELK